MLALDKTTDGENRKIIVTNFDDTLFVDAGAGSGKTTIMVARILAILISSPVLITEIAAITFTTEGAASLKSKIRGKIEEAIKAFEEGQEVELTDGVDVKITEKAKDNLKEALSLLPLAQFTTIHSFCLSLLKERPIEACIDPQFEMNMEGNDVSCFDEAWTKYILNLSEENSTYIKFIIEKSISIDDLKQMAVLKGDNPDLQLYTEKADDISEKDINDTFKRCESYAQMFFDAKPYFEEKKIKKNGELNNSALKQIAACEKVIKEFLTNKTTEEKRTSIFNYSFKTIDWGKEHKDLHEALETMARICNELKKRYYDHVHSKLAGLITGFEAYFSDYKRKSSKLQFNDLLYISRNLLKENNEVREYYKRRFKYIFIDETQDTDPMQTEIMFFLCEKEGLYEKKWQNITLHPGKLFMVGDPKQSIYKFRRADIQIYDEAKRIIASQGGKILKLTKNFRSSSVIINLVNDHFNSSFNTLTAKISQGNNDYPKLNPDYIPLSAAAHKQDNLPFNLFQISHDQNGTKRDYQAYVNKIAGFIKFICNNNEYSLFDPESGEKREIKYSDIMLLFNRMKYADRYTAVFEREGIPYVEVGSKTFFKTSDVRSLIFALKAIDDSSDTVSLFGTLVSPLFGITEKDIFDFVNSGEHRRFNLFAKEKDGYSNISNALNFLKYLYYQKGKLLPSIILKSIFDFTGICHLSLFDPNGIQNTAKYYRVLELAMEIEADQSLSYHSVVSRLEEIMNAKEPKFANISLNKKGENAVKFMTVHKAKGLEAPVVIIADENAPEFPPNSIVLRECGKIIIPFMELGGYYSQPDSIIELERLKEICEKERLRYVAATRAMCILAISVPENPNCNKTFCADFRDSIKNSGKFKTIDGYDAGSQACDESGSPVDMEKEFETAQGNIRKNFNKFSESLINNEPVFISVHNKMNIDKSIYRIAHKARGMKFGIIIHKIMEYYVMNENFELLSILDSWMVEIEVENKYRQDIINTFGKIKDNKFVLEAKAAKEKYCEWEFFIKDNDKIVNGIIDAVYKDLAGNWIILDYKTDDVSDSERREKLDEIYKKQLDLYSGYFKKITGHNVADTRIIYTEES